MTHDEPGQPAPALSGTTLDGAPFDLAAVPRQARRSSTSGRRGAARARPSSRSSRPPSRATPPTGLTARRRRLPGHGRRRPSRSSPSHGATWPNVTRPVRHDRHGLHGRRSAADLLHRRRPASSAHARSARSPRRTSTGSSPRSCRDGRRPRSAAPAIAVSDLRKSYAGRPVVDGLVVLGRGPASVVRDARPERGGQDDDGRDPRGLPPPGRRRGPRPGPRPGDGRRRAPRPGRADAPGRRDLPAGPAARDPPPVRPLLPPSPGPGRAARAGRPGRRRRRPATRSCRAARSSASGSPSRSSGRPELAILDEPTAGMDPAAKASTRELIASLRDEGYSPSIADRRACSRPSASKTTAVSESPSSVSDSFQRSPSR